MPSQIPKTAATRRRHSRQPGARTLTAVPGLRVPPLPAHRQWNDETREWWWNVWTSPMAPEFDESDYDELLMLARLVNRYWAEPEPSKDLLAEIRLQRQCFGLTPIDRRRLQWEMDRGDEAEKRRAARRPTPQATSTRKDPRKLLA